MLRIVGVQRSENPQEEFVLLQNQGHMRVSLHGHLLVAECAYQGVPLNRCAFAFSDDEFIPPSLFVILSTACGQPHWGRTKDGSYVFYTFMNRTAGFWNQCSLPLHILAPHHTFVDRSDRVEFLAVR